MIAAILAMTEKGVIGNNGDLPWPRIADDMKWFRDVTRGNVVIMGRKTWDSLPDGPLPKRDNVVITRNTSPLHKAYHSSKRLPMNVIFSSNYPDMLADGTVNRLPSRATSRENKIFLMGGAEIYRQGFPYCDRIYLTIVKGDYEGDTVIDNIWQVLENFTLMEEHDHDECRMEIWERDIEYADVS